MIELIFAVSLAIIISAGCSLFEAVLYSVPMRHIETMVQEEKKSGKIFKTLKGDIEKPITAILSLNTLANTAGAAIAGAAATAVFGYQWLGYFSLFFTLAILVFSEVIPKTAGVVYAKSLVPFVAFPLKFLVKIMVPAVWLCSHITKLISKGRKQESVSPEELKTLARVSLRMGGIKPYQEIVIENVLSLENKTVKDVMTPRTVVFSLSEHLLIEDAYKKSGSWEHSRFPVYDNDIEDVVGIVLLKDIFITQSEGKKNVPLTELMRPVHFVVETAMLSDVLADFIGAREHLFVVIDEYGGLSGIITLEDVLEEILGREIVDESDKVDDKRKLARNRRNNLVSRFTNDR